MLTIEGTTYAEVFSNLRDRPELSDAERTAAGKVAGWFERRDQLEADEQTLRNDPDYDPTLEDTDPVAEHAARAPFFGPTFPEHQMGQEWRTWVCGAVRFKVWPYTTGATMNVGVDRVERSRVEATR